MSKRARKILLIAVVAVAVATVAFIFGNSLLASGASWRESNAVGSLLSPVLGVLYEAAKHVATAFGAPSFYTYGAFVRKTAHFTEYLLLGAECTGLAAALAGKLTPARLAAALSAPLAIALADEFVLQSLSDRTSLATDVLIDFSGALTGALAMTAIVLLLSRRKAQ